MDNASTRAQLLEHFLSVFMPEGILDFFELVWAESQSLDSRERMTDQFPVRYRGIHVAMEYYSGGKYYWDYDAVKAAFDKVQ